MPIVWQGGPRPASPESTCAVMIDDMRERSSRSGRTLVFYRESLSVILRDLRAIGRTTFPWELTSSDIKALMEFWRVRNLTVSTRRGYVSVLRTWTRYWGNDAIDELEIRWPADTRPTVDWLTDDEVFRLIGLELGPLQDMIIHCELCLGMRRVEIIRSKVDDWQEPYVDILGKGPQGGKPRRMPYHPDTKAVLDRYLSYRKQICTLGKIKNPEIEDPGYLLIYLKGKSLLGYSAKGTGIDDLLKPAQNGIGRNFSNHTLRRTFGRMMYRSGVDVATICKMMGHESQDTTLRYIGVNLDDMADAMKKFVVKRG